MNLGQSRQCLFYLIRLACGVGCLLVAGVAAAQGPPMGMGGPPATPVGDQVMAWVADQPIFASEIFSRVDAVMAENKDRIPAEQWDQQRLQFAQQALKSAVESKLVLSDALHKVPAASLTEIEKKVNEQFETEHVKKLMQSTKAESRADLDAKLRATGSSLEHQRRIYYERSIGTQWVHQMVKSDKEVTHDEMVTYYESHLKDFDHIARARWEQLTIDFSRFPNKEAAYAAIARMGNDVMRGVPFAEIAKAGSQGSTAKQGGQREWTTEGSLASQALDRALFTLPVGTLSPILEDERSFHIIRVVEREDAYRTPFRDAQIKIREEIEKQNRVTAIEEYYAKLRSETRVQTVFDDPAAAERFANSLPSTRPR
ncbi:MAG: peptidyl-prolyl cis-trans isomerase [Planctomycetia bacterium]|nr:peptidyl-prolyl cis-trans isomerase [Planctomycetia bacterium]